MGLLGSFLQKVMLTDPEVRDTWNLIQKLRDNGDHAEADRRQRDLEQTLHNIFANDDENQDEA